MRHLLPPNLGELARITDAEATRYAIGGVRLELGEEKYVAVATDARSMVIVEGAYIEEAPLISSVGPSTASAAVIPAKHWRKAFTSAPKKRTKNGKTLFPAPFVEVSAHPQSTQLATAELDTESVRTVRNLEGRVPQYEAIVPTGTPRAIVALDPRRLIDLLTVASKFITLEKFAITIAVYGHDDSVWITADNGEQKFRGVICNVHSDEVDEIGDLITAEEKNAIARAAIEHITHEPGTKSTVKKPAPKKRTAKKK